MTAEQVAMVRVCLAERGGQVDEILRFRRAQHHMRGRAVYRGVSGFGDSGKVRRRIAG